MLTYTVYDKYAGENYVFTVGGTVGDSADTSIYMSRDTFNAVFGEASDWFDAYASDDDLAIEPDYLASVTTLRDIQKLADQRILAVPGSGFGYAGYFRLALCVDKQVIENARAGFIAAARA